VRGRKNKYRPPHERESRFVVQTIRKVVREYEGSGCVPWIVIDREGDATVTLDELRVQPVQFTVRASWNRRVKGGCRQHYLRERMKRQSVAMRYTVHVAAGFKRKERMAELSVRVGRVELDVRHDWQAKRENPTLNVVWAREMRGPRDEKPLDWMLYTNAPVDTEEDIALVIHSYMSRWRIEDFHRTWKSGGCCVEDTQLRSKEAVKTWATMLGAVAVRIERLKHLARNEPGQLASVELTAIEIEALILLKRDQKAKNEVVPDGVPTIAVAVRWIADVGGYTGKSSGGPPGSITIGRGMDDVRAAVRVLQALRAQRGQREMR
jgi:hypothetical protein